jgi:nucleotide-binding universal stress UspA family protein
VLLHPPQPQPVQAHRIVMGWKNTREARHAIWAALPFLLAAESVTLVRFSSTGEEDGSLEAVAERLQRHGVKVTCEYPHRVNATVAEDLIATADELRADMIVAGGYGHSRTRELILGGVTRGLLSQCPCHLLLCH